jgi:signal transduction histidine kinase
LAYSKAEYLARIVVLVFVYFAWAQCVRWLTPGVVRDITPIWPPTGIGLAVFILSGYRYWPGILAGEIIVTATVGTPVSTALGAGVANTLEAMVGAYLLRRVRGFDHSLSRLSDVWAFVSLGALAAPIAGASLGLVSLVLDRSSPLSVPLVDAWWLWWLCDAMGALLIAPVLLTWSTAVHERWGKAQYLEIAALGALMILWVWGFSDLMNQPVYYPLEYLFFPFVVWAALRLGPAGSTATLLLATAITTWDWSRGLGFMAANSKLESLLEIQGFLAGLSVTGLVLAAITVQRQQAEISARSRAEDLDKLNQVLRLEVEQREKTEQLARGQRDGLAKSLRFLTAEPDRDRFLGHVLQVMIDELKGIGGELWFPDGVTHDVHLHLEYAGGKIRDASNTKHPTPTNPSFIQYLPYVGGQQSAHASRFIDENDPIISPDVWEYLRSCGSSGLLCVPMLVGDKPIGWITVHSCEQPELEDKVDFIEALARQAALAIEMAKFGDEVCDLAIVAERNRIARDIHDSLAQGFTGIILQLQAAEDDLIRNDYETVKSHVARAGELARTSLSEARRSVLAIRSRTPDDLPLMRTIADLIKKPTEGTPLSTAVSVQGEAWALSATQEAELLRIVQEALTNTLKHAQASRFDVKLIFTANALQMKIQDNGRGFRPKSYYEGFGLKGMQERAARLGGSFHLRASPGKGTELRIVIPRDR